MVIVQLVSCVFAQVYRYEYYGNISCKKIGGPPSKPKYTSMIDSEEYREGKVK